MKPSIPTFVLALCFAASASAQNSTRPFQKLHIPAAISGGRPFFNFDDKPYARNVINQTVKLGAVEHWTIRNNNIFGHTFHIRDV